MKQPSKFKRWVLGLFGGVPKSDYDIVVEQRENFIGDTKINEARIKELERENELLKKQVAPIGSLPLEQTEFCLRDAVLMEIAPFVKIEQQPFNMTMTATLLLAEREDV